MQVISHKPIWGFVAILFLIGLAIQVFIVPQQMDEHGMFHLLACDTYPMHYLHIYREACTHLYDVTFAGLFKWRYAAPYTGSLMDRLYRPLFTVWPDPYSFFLFTLFFWGVCVVLLAKLVRAPLGIAFLALGMNFAFVYHMVHGVSSVPPNIFMLVIPMIAVKAMSSKRPWLYGILAGLLMCMGIEAKMFFFYIIPGIAFLSATCIWAWYPLNRSIILSALKFGVAAGIVSGTFAYVLISSPAAAYSSMTHGQRVMHYSRNYTLSDFWPYLYNLIANFKAYWGDLSSVMNRVYKPSDVAWWKPTGTGFWTLFNWLIMFVTCAYAVLLERKERLLAFRLDKFIAGCALTSIIMMLVVGTNIKSWTHHHHFHPIVPVFYAFAASLGVLWKRRLGKTLIVPSFAVLLALSSNVSVIIGSMQPLVSRHFQYYLPANETFDYEKIVLWLRQPQVGNNAVVIHTGWGMYYTTSLYGASNQLIMYVYNLRDVELAYQRTQFLGRPYLFIIKEGYYADYLVQKFKNIYDLTQQVMADTPIKPGLRYMCMPPLPGMKNLCNNWMASQAPSGWRVLSTIPYDELMTKTTAEHVTQ
jgi:hypothetical protein